jgi:NADPH:quinone reductase-like Zn-dependent oxidoreductase
MIARRYRILAVIMVLVAGALAVAAFAVSHDAPCGASSPLPAGAEPMRAVVRDCYGSPAVLRIEEIATPTPADKEVLVDVRAVAINPADWHTLTGTPYVTRISIGLGAPNGTGFGADFAGVVVSVGNGVTRFKIGDEVFGARSGAMADYVTASEDRTLALKPPNVTFEEAAAIPIAAITALQGLRDHGRIQPGQKVLINGASGGVGTFAVQIAKAFGAQVTAVCSTRNVELVRSLGADHVIDYTRQNFTESTERYDLILDNVGNHPVLATRRVLGPNGTLVVVSGPKDDPWLGPLTRFMEAKLLSRFVRQDLIVFFARTNRHDLEFLAELVRTGKVTPAIDRTYSMNQVRAAIGYLGEGHARAKVVVHVD